MHFAFAHPMCVIAKCRYHGCDLHDAVSLNCVPQLRMFRMSSTHDISPFLYQYAHINAFAICVRSSCQLIACEPCFMCTAVGAACAHDLMPDQCVFVCGYEHLSKMSLLRRHAARHPRRLGLTSSSCRESVAKVAIWCGVNEMLHSGCTALGK